MIRIAIMAVFLLACNEPVTWCEVSDAQRCAELEGELAPNNQCYCGDAACTARLGAEPIDGVRVVLDAGDPIGHRYQEACSE